MGLFDLFKFNQFEKMFENAIENGFGEPPSENELYDEIIKNYLILLKLLRINSFNSFHFSDYEDCRTVVIDGKEYDFDSKFRHNNIKATEALYAIDALIADLDDDLEVVLKNIEEKLNSNL